MKIKFQLPVLLLGITVCFSTLSSCEKDDDDIVVESKTALLTALPWKQTALTCNPAYDWFGNGNAITNILDSMPFCQKDNFDSYRTTGVWELDEGATKCSPTASQTVTATWAFTDNENKIIFDGFDEYILVELTTTTLKFRRTFVENGVTYTVDYAYGH